MVEATARRRSGDRFEPVSSIALVLAGLWCVVLVIGAVTLPVYSGRFTSPNGVESRRATLVEVNGAWALVVVAQPAIPVVVVATALWLRRRTRKPGPGAAVWTTVGVLGVFAFVTGFTIGLFVVPLVVLLAIACAAASAPPRPATEP